MFNLIDEKKKKETLTVVFVIAEYRNKNEK